MYGHTELPALDENDNAMESLAKLSSTSHEMVDLPCRDIIRPGTQQVTPTCAELITNLLTPMNAVNANTADIAPFPCQEGCQGRSEV
jgi:hypothetical protein